MAADNICSLWKSGTIDVICATDIVKFDSQKIATTYKD